MHGHSIATSDAEEAEQLALAIALSKAELQEQQPVQPWQQPQPPQQQQRPAVPQPARPAPQPAPPPPAPAPLGRGAGATTTTSSSSGGFGGFLQSLRSLRDDVASGIAAGAGALGIPRCAGCGRHATGSLEPLITLAGGGGGGEAVYHLGCFRCGGCGQPLAQGGGGRFEYVMGGGSGSTGSTGEQQRPYHPQCHRARFDPRCCVCHDLIPRTGGSRIEWHTHPFWKELQWCPAHSCDGTPQCCACGRLEPRGAEWPALADGGRRLCLDCLGTVTLDTADAQPVYADVQRFFKLSGLPLPAAAPPLLLVECKVLTEYAAREGLSRGGGGDAGPVFHVRGLCLATVYASIPSIARAGGLAGLLGVASVSAALRAPQQRCSVQGLLVLYGLPRLLTGSIIAHELTHAWIRMRHVAHLDPQLEEGLCQLMAYLWLEAQAHAAAADGPGAERLLSYLAHQIRTDASPIYGDGFRAALAAFQARGVKALFDHALAQRCFPV